MERAYCYECRKEVNYTISEKELAMPLKGETYTFIGKIAQCNDCNSEVYVAEIDDANMEALYDAYRIKNSLISSAHLKELITKYDIGKRPLSLLLNWGEMTYSRYFDGDMPTKQYSSILEKIYNDPNYFLSILEANKEQITQTAYEKSKRATLALIGLNEDRSILDLVIEYLVEQCEDITPLALQKALYYIQGFFYAFYNRFIFTEDCEAWVHGPVYRDVYNRYSQYRFDPIEPKREAIDDTCFTTNEKVMLDSIIHSFCCYSGKVLEHFTHEENPWLQTRGDLPWDFRCDKTIDKSLIGEYFSAVKKKYDMLSPSDIGSYAHDMFCKSCR